MPQPDVALSAPRGSQPTVVLTFCWSFAIPGGVARHLQELARALALAGVKVVIVNVMTMRYSSFPRPPLPREFRGEQAEADLAELGVEVVRVDPHPLHWTMDARMVGKAVERLLRERRVDAVLSFYIEARYLPALCRRYGVRFGVIATWQSYRMAYDIEMSFKGLKGWIRRHLYERSVMRPYRAAEILFANSEFTRGELHDVFGIDASRVHVTYLGVDPRFSEIPRPDRGRVRNLLFFGRLFPEKGIFDALEALGRLHAEGMDDWTLRILGTGMRDEVQQRVRALGIEERIELERHQEDEGLFAALAWADLAVLPSHSESFGLAIAESSAAGLPVVAFHAGSVPEVVVDGETGWLAPLKDVPALAQALSAALTNPIEARRRGLAGRARVESEFRWPRTAKRMIAGLRTLAGPTGVPRAIWDPTALGAMENDEEADEIETHAAG